MFKKSIFIFIAVISAAITAGAQSSPAAPGMPTDKKELIIQKIEMELSDNEVLDFLKKVVTDIGKADKAGEPIKYQEYTKYTSMLQFCTGYRWFIADTGLSQKWIKNIYDLVEYMRNTRNIIKTEILNGHTSSAKYKQAEKYYQVAYGRLVKLIQKPVKVSSKIQRQQKLQKVLWQREMRKKYKIDKKDKAPLL
jgi:hypothetical protein